MIELKSSNSCADVNLLLLFCLATLALLPDDFLIAGEVLMHQSLLLPAVKRDKCPAAAGTVYRIRFRESSIYAFKVAKFHCAIIPYNQFHRHSTG